MRTSLSQREIVAAIHKIRAANDPARSVRDRVNSNQMKIWEDSGASQKG